MTSVHEFVKQGTLAHHREAERAFEAFDLGTAGGYRDFLLAQAAAFLPLEEAAERGGIAELLGDWPARHRGDALRADLRRLGAIHIPSMAVPEGLDPLGIAYVLEGSRHGGRMLLAAVLANRPEAAETVSFLQHSPGSGWWRSFVEVLDAQRGEGRAASLLGSAQAAFRLFENAARLVAGNPGAAREPDRVTWDA